MVDFDASSRSAPGNLGVWLISLYLIVDYARIQDVVHIGFLHPGMILIIIMALYVLKNREFGLRFKEIRLIWLFFLLICCYIPFAKNNFHAYKTAKAFALFFPVILTILVSVIELKYLKILINFIIAIAIYMSLYALMHSGQGSGGYFNDENDLSLFLNMIVPVCYYLLIASKGDATPRKIFYGLGFCLNLLAIVVSFSRGGFVGLLAVFGCIWLFGKHKLKLALVSLLIFSALFYFGGDLYKHEMMSVTDTHESTAQARLQSWAAGWRMFLDNPLGVGGNNFQVRFPEYQGEWFKRGMWGRVAHSLWFTLLPEMGIVGVCIYLRLMYLIFRRLVLVRKEFENIEKPREDLCYLYNLATGILVGLVGFFVSGSFLSVLYYPHFWYFCAIVIVLSECWLQNKDMGELQVPDRCPQI